LICNDLLSNKLSPQSFPPDVFKKLAVKLIVPFNDLLKNPYKYAPSSFITIDKPSGKKIPS